MPAQSRLRDRSAADRRGALRHPVAMEGVLSCPASAPIAVVVVDISEGGCQIVRPDALTRDTSILLSFGGYAPFDATVMWTSPRAAGLRFDYPVHPALIAQVVAAAKGRKRAKRVLSPGLVRREERERLYHLKLEVTFEDAAARANARPRLGGILSDLSVDGCRIASEVAMLPGAVAPGTGLLIHIGGHAPMLGIVRWCGEEGIGIEFGEPLSPVLVESVAQFVGVRP